jgi:hypothetical protein
MRMVIVEVRGRRGLQGRGWHVLGAKWERIQGGKKSRLEKIYTAKASYWREGKKSKRKKSSDGPRGRWRNGSRSNQQSLCE